MQNRLIKLRYAGTCRVCSTPVASKATAWHDPVAKKITCCACRPEEAETPAPRPLPPPQPIARGVAGLSAHQQFEKRLANHAQRTALQPGNEGVDALTAELPQHTRAWLAGAIGEELLGAYLDFQVGVNAFVLHDRKVPGTRGNIDHIVIAESGVWVVDAKNYTGKVEERDAGTWLRSDIRLFVNNRNQTKLVHQMQWQVGAVRQHLERMGFASMPIHRALCFTDTTWAKRAKPFPIDGVWVTWPEALVDKIRRPGPVPPDLRRAVATELSAQLPATA